MGGVHEVGRFGGGEEVDDRRQRFVVDHDHVGGVLGDVAILRQHQRDGIADETNLALRERRARRVVRDRSEQRVPLLVHPGIEVLRDEDCVHTLECRGLGRVDVDDAGSRVRAADEAGVEHAGQLDVVDERAVSRQQPGILDALDAAAGISRRARVRGVRHVPLRRATTGANACICACGTVT